MINGKVKHKEKCTITNLILALQFLFIAIHSKDTRICLGQRTSNTGILKPFSIEDTHCVLIPLDPNVKLNLANNTKEKELDDITDYQAFMGSLICPSFATWPNILYVITALSHYNPHPFTSYMAAAKRVAQNYKSAAVFRLLFNLVTITVNINTSSCLVGYSGLVWADHSANSKSQGDGIFLTHNGALLCQSWKISFLTISTFKAKFIASSEESREAK